jgi:ATP synthase protein I
LTPKKQGLVKPGETEPVRLEPIKLTDAERKKVQASAVNGLVRVLVAQAGMMLVAVVVSWAIAGFEAGASALLGALSCFIPSALFAARLLLGMAAGRPASPGRFLVGELVKLLASILLLVLVVYLAQSWLVWPALLFGLLMVLKGYVLLLMFGRLP